MIVRIPAIALVALLCLLQAPRAAATIEAFDFPNAEAEARYYRLIAEMRCPKCLNTNLAGSDGPIAADLRREIHRQVVAGKTEAEVREFMQARYGDFVLYRPPLRPSTWLLWFGPLLLLLAGGGVIAVIVRRRAAAGVPPDDDLAAEAAAIVARHRQQ